MPCLNERERARFLSVFEYAPDPILITDENDTIVLANQACRAVLGWEDGELVGQTVDAIVGTDGSGWRASEADESESPTLMARRKDGGLCSVDLKMSPLMLEGAEHKSCR